MRCGLINIAATTTYLLIFWWLLACEGINADKLGGWEKVGRKMKIRSKGRNEGRDCKNGDLAL